MQLLLLSTGASMEWCHFMYALLKRNVARLDSDRGSCFQQRQGGIEAGRGFSQPVTTALVGIVHAHHANVMIPRRLGASDYMSDDILIPTPTEFLPHDGLGSFDAIAWRLASVLCRRCWHPWWRHGHGPFRALVDCPAGHLFDAL